MTHISSKSFHKGISINPKASLFSILLKLLKDLPDEREKMKKGNDVVLKADKLNILIKSIQNYVEDLLKNCYDRPDNGVHFQFLGQDILLNTKSNDIDRTLKVFILIHNLCTFTRDSNDSVHFYSHDSIVGLPEIAPIRYILNKNPDGISFHELTERCEDLKKEEKFAIFDFSTVHLKKVIDDMHKKKLITITDYKNLIKPTDKSLLLDKF